MVGQRGTPCLVGARIVAHIPAPAAATFHIGKASGSQLFPDLGPRHGRSLSSPGYARHVFRRGTPLAAGGLRQGCGTLKHSPTDTEKPCTASARVPLCGKAAVLRERLGAAPPWLFAQANWPPAAQVIRLSLRVKFTYAWKNQARQQHHATYYRFGHSSSTPVTRFIGQIFHLVQRRAGVAASSHMGHARGGADVRYSCGRARRGQALRAAVRVFAHVGGNATVALHGINLRLPLLCWVHSGPIVARHFFLANCRCCPSNVTRGTAVSCRYTM